MLPYSSITPAAPQHNPMATGWGPHISHSATGTSLEHSQTAPFVGSGLNQAWPSTAPPPWTFQNYQSRSPLKQGGRPLFYSSSATFLPPASQPPGPLPHSYVFSNSNAYAQYQHPTYPPHPPVPTQFRLTFPPPPAPLRPYPGNIYQPGPPAPIYHGYAVYPPPSVPNISNYYHNIPPNYSMMMSSPTSPRSPTVGSPPATICWQNELTQKCAELGMAPPEFHLKSDRRGGRTAWQSWVAVNGGKFESRFSYAGHHNAQEDAAEVALKCLVAQSPQIPTTPVIPTTYPGFTRPYPSVAPSSSPPSSSHFTLGSVSGNVSSQTSPAVSVPHRQQPPIQHHQFQGFNVN